MEALVGYDCTTRPKLTPISLLQPKPCEEARKLYTEGTVEKAQIIQGGTALPVTVTQCLVRLTKQVTRCGYNSLTYAHAVPMYHTTQPVPENECRAAARTGRIHIDGHPLDVTRETTVGRSWVSQGQVLPDGSCVTEEGFSTNGHNFAHSYETTMAKITVRTLPGMADPSGGLLTIEGRMVVPYQAKQAFDNDMGTLIWDYDAVNCTNRLSEIFAGNITVARLKKPEAGDKDRGALAIVEHEGLQQYAGLQLKAPTDVCGRHCYSTQASAIMVCLMREFDGPLPDLQFNNAASQTRTLFQTQASYLHLDTNRRMYDRFEVVQNDVCQLERKMLQNRLHSVAAENDPYALQDLFGMGHDLLRAGAVVYLVKCEPVMVKRAHYPNCTQEVPVNRTSDARGLEFMDPVSRLLRDMPVVVPCSTLTPIMWKLNGRWYCHDGVTRQCQPPQQLATNSTPFQEDQYTAGMGNGLYSPQQQKEHAAYQRAVHAKSPVVAILGARAAAHMRDGYGPMGSILGPVEMDQISISVGSMIIPFFQVFGFWWTTIMGLLIIAGTLKTVLGMMIRVIAVYREKGVGPHLILALWHTTYDLMMLPFRLAEAAAMAIQRPGEPLPALAGPGPPGPPPPPGGGAAVGSRTANRVQETFQKFRPRWPKLKSGSGSPPAGPTGGDAPSRPAPPPYLPCDQEMQDLAALDRAAQLIRQNSYRASRRDSWAPRDGRREGPSSPRAPRNYETLHPTYRSDTDLDDEPIRMREGAADRFHGHRRRSRGRSTPGPSAEDRQLASRAGAQSS